LIPRPLLALLGAVAVAVVAWALLVPPFMVPDEAEHFTYAQSLAVDAERPPVGRPGDPGLSSEARTARGLSLTTGVLADRQYKPSWERVAEQIWDQHEDEVADDDVRAAGPQANHPPLYYAYEVVPYAAASGGDLFDRLFLMRLWSGLLMLATTAGAWLLIGELTGRDRLLQLTGAACVGLQPMSTFVSAGVNPDALVLAAFALFLWLAVRLIRRGPSRAGLAGLVAVTAVAVLSKPAGLALVPGLALVVVVLARRRGSRTGPLLAGGLALAAALTAAGVLTERDVQDRAPIELDPATLRGFTTYLWDFYLPRLPFQSEYAALAADTPVWTVWVKHAWASFGLLEVQFPRGVYVPLALAGVAAFAAAGLALARRRFALERTTLGVLALVTACLVLGLHWVDFQAVEDGGQRVIQGRYLLPLMPIAGVAVAAALSNLARRREVAAGLVLAAMAALQLVSLATVAGRYFA
jgi:4-amino-4-deoxy-L-arabinose transferase-like glycosyltransferase